MTAPKDRRLEHLVKQDLRKAAGGGNKDPAPASIPFFFVLSGSLAVLTGIGWAGYAVKSGFFRPEQPEMSAVKRDLRIIVNPGSANIVYHPEPKKVYPPLNSKEGSELDSLFGNSKAVQEFINYRTYYSYDHEQFGGSLCPPGSERCDIWMSAAHFYRIKEGDCDDVLAFAHYLLRDGVGIYLESLDDQKVPSHTVYLYRQHGKYGIVSIHELEQTDARFNSIDEAANSVRYSYDYYQVLGLPNNAEKLLYGFDIKKDIARGQKIYFPPKKEENKK